MLQYRLFKLYQDALPPVDVDDKAVDLIFPDSS